MKKYFAYLMVLVFVLMTSVSVVYAQNAPGSKVSAPLQNPFKAGTADNIPQLFQTIIKNIIIPIGAVIAILAFIYAGFLYVTAAGDEKKIGTAHKALLYAAVGTAVLLGAGVIAQVIQATVNQLQ